jgi:hypothetical protein
LADCLVDKISERAQAGDGVEGPSPWLTCARHECTLPVIAGNMGVAAITCEARANGTFDRQF